MLFLWELVQSGSWNKLIFLKCNSGRAAPDEREYERVSITVFIATCHYWSLTNLPRSIISIFLFQGGLSSVANTHFSLSDITVSMWKTKSLKAISSDCCLKKTFEWLHWRCHAYWHWKIRIFESKGDGYFLPTCAEHLHILTRKQGKIKSENTGKCIERLEIWKWHVNSLY